MPGEPDAPDESVDRDHREIVSAITPVDSDPNLRRVYVGDRCVAELRAIDVEAIGLAVGEAWTSALAADVAAALALAAAHREALSILARRGRTHAEVIDRLEQRGHTDSVARRAADELVENGWIDDEAVARETIELVLRKGPAAAAHLRQRIEARGIDPAIARRTVADVLEGTDPVEDALTVARARAEPGEDPSPAVVRRIAGALARRGFDEDTVAIVLDRLGLGEDRCEE